ncbi:hypothetical protein DFH06DRAFT_1467071 [Mycena polygramma]|nr:hypothetical protein DFH06DRAFT_1467071 [Mycena polygramma]
MTHPCWKCGSPANDFIDSTPAPETAPGLTRLRTSNDAPLDSEIPLIREITSDGEERLNNLQSQVRHLEIALVNLVQRRDEAAEHVRQHRGILHPHRRAPPELICEIFALALDTPDDSGNDGFAYTPPWYLGQICRSWRLWALAYPRLWSHITIPSSPPHPIDRVVLETLLLRSSIALLNVRWMAENEDEDEPSVDRKMANLALLHCRRWATLRIDLSRCTATHTLNLNWLRPVKGGLPSLRRLDVVCSGNNVRIPDVFSVAPSLSQVLLTNWKLAHYSPNMQLPWDQITDYRGAFREATQLDILRAAPKLVQCAISFETPNSAPMTPGTSSSIALSHLRRLYIEQPRFLHHLIAPSLEELYCMYMQPGDIPSLLPFVRNSDCLLQKLVITACQRLPDLVTALRSLPSLRYLLIQPRVSIAEQTDLFRELEITGTSQVLCPRLHSLVYGVWGELPHEPFCTMVRLRFRGSRLTHFRVFDPVLNGPIFVATKELRDEGFDAGMLTETEFELLAGKAFFA